MDVSTCPRLAKGLRQESHVLYTLLDAADSAGLISDSILRQQWRTTDSLVRAGASYEAHVDTFYELLNKLESSSALAGTWIEERWAAIQSRMSAPPF